MASNLHKLEKILPLINSDVDGEAHSAFLAVRRYFQTDGLELVDIIRAGSIAVAAEARINSYSMPTEADRMQLNSQKIERTVDEMKAYFEEAKQRRKADKERIDRSFKVDSTSVTNEPGLLPDRIPDAKVRLISRKKTRENKSYLVVSVEYQLQSKIYLCSPILAWDKIASNLENQIRFSQTNAATGEIQLRKPRPGQKGFSPVIVDFRPQA